MRAACPSRKICTVTGVVEWTASSPARNSKSEGSAKFTYQLALATDDIRVISETSEVLARRVTKR
jgi:hypothetical protein